MMKLCVLILQPESGFGTPLKGDTLFGQFCWQVEHDPSLLENGLAKWIPLYLERPFAVFSSAYPRLSGEGTLYALKRPDLPPPFWPRERIPVERKDFKRKKWILVKENLLIDLDSVEILDDGEMETRAWKKIEAGTRENRNGSRKYVLNMEQTHNTINRMTGTTGEGMFSPYSESLWYYPPEAELAVFVLFDEEATDLERICKGVEMIGCWGYGKDASIGRGKFSLKERKYLSWPPAEGANACYILGPVVPEKGRYQDYFFMPFVRFGKHGDFLANSGNPFKNPVIMADEGAVFIPRNREVFEKPYIGRGLTGLSKAMTESVGQGYSIYLPFRMEMRHE